MTNLITLNHGGGGKATQKLIRDLFATALDNPLLAPLDDCARLDLNGSRLAFTTDSYVVDPIFFPGGDIGTLAVNGTINDLATSGADPLWLSLGLIIEEGLPLADLRRVTDSIARAARAAGVQVVTGDTKVVPRGKADKLFINTAGIGIIRHEQNIAQSSARPGDRVLISGPIGEHGVAVLAARGQFDFELETISDTAPLHGMVAAVLGACGAVHCLKDPTRGGLAGALEEIARTSGVGIELRETAIPICTAVRSACELLGLDPLQIANEGRMLIIAPASAAEAALAAMRGHPLGCAAEMIGTVVEEPRGLVLLKTAVGGRRIVDAPTGEALPRIC